MSKPVSDQLAEVFDSSIKETQKRRDQLERDIEALDADLKLREKQFNANQGREQKKFDEYCALKHAELSAREKAVIDRETQVSIKENEVIEESKQLQGLHELSSQLMEERRSLDKLKSEIQESLDKRTVELTTRELNLSDSMVSLNKNSSDEIRKINELKNSVYTKEAEIEIREKAIEENLKKSESLITQYEDMIRQVPNYEERISDKEKEISALNEELDKYKRELKKYVK